MPRIRTITAQTRPQGALNVRGATGGDFGAQTGVALDRLGQTLLSISEQMDRAREASDLASATADATRRLQEVNAELTTGRMDAEGNFIPPPRPREASSMFQQRVQDIENDAKARLGEGTTFATFSSKLQTLASRTQLDIGKSLLKRQKEEIAVNMERMTDEMAVAVANGSPLERVEATRQFMSLLDNLQETTAIDPKQRLKLEQTFQDQVASHDVYRDIRENPEQALLNLTQNKYNGLSPKQQQIMINRAEAALDRKLRREQAQEDRAFRMEERARRQREDATNREAILRWSRGELDPTWVSSQVENGNLSATASKHWIDISANPDMKIRENPITVGTLDRLMRTNPEDALQAATELLKNMQLRPSTYGALLDEYDSVLRKSSPRVADAVSRIRGSMPAGLLKDPFASQRYAEAIFEMKEWARENPDLVNDAKAVRERSDSLIERARFAAFGDIDAALLLPEDASFNRENMTIEAVQNDAQAVRELRDNGAIDQEEYEKRIELLGKWFNAATLKEQLKARRAAKNDGG